MPILPDEFVHFIKKGQSKELEDMLIIPEDVVRSF